MNTRFGKAIFVLLVSTTILLGVLLPMSALAQVNTATGAYALFHNTTGFNNTADGYGALDYNTTGSNNAAVGAYTLFYNTAGGLNSALGAYALFSNTSGGYNTAQGYEALYSNTIGGYNTAAGAQVLRYNTSGSYNAATGTFALFYNTTGYYNAADGYAALYSNTTGGNNSAVGALALYFNTTGSYNTASGLDALLQNTTGSNNVGLGYGAGQNITTGNNNIAIGNSGASSDNGVIRIGTAGTQGATYIAGINGATASQGVPVYIDANGQLGTLTSSRRFKYDIKDLGATSDKLMGLRPRIFRYKEEASDGSHPIQYGLIAEEVAQVYPEMVQYDREGKPFTVYYQQLTPMMLNELQKAHRHMLAQDRKIDSLESKLGSMPQAKGDQEVNALKSELASMQHAQTTQFHMLAALVLTIVVLGVSVLDRPRGTRKEAMKVASDPLS